ncbi:MAG: DUF4026 domain-containing protein [Myxococcales bacterium]|nr:DUF4026 domain-containing protein [Myxococcales bacterium]
MTPSTCLRALLPRGHVPSVSEVASRLEGAGVRLRPAAGGTCRWSLEGAVPAGARELPVRVRLRPSAGVPAHLAEGRPHVAAEAEGVEFELIVEATIGAAPAHEYHALLKVVAAAAPEARLFVDDAAYTARFPAWVEAAARSAAPPSPRALYTVHAVEADGRVWIHTHGLCRCGAIELEMLDVPADAADCLAPLVHAVAAQWMEQGPPCPGQTFAAGRDLELAWAPWPKALSKLAPAGPGGERDRDPLHAVPAGVLYVPERGLARTRWRCPSTLAPALRADPLLYVSETETERMRLLAQERWPTFVAALAAHRGEEDWRFLVKLAFEAEGGRREHLWAEAHAADAEAVDVTLLSAPRLVALEPGARAAHPTHRLSDWLVITPHGDVGPDDAIALED